MSTQPRKSVTSSVDVVVIGAGQSGLAMSRFLGERSIEHVVFERGEVANSWRTERWDSLRLLTPNWQSTLPGYKYAGPEPDAYMSMAEVVDFISGYATFTRAPVRTGIEVQSLSPVDGGYRVDTNDGSWSARAVVIASGAFNVPIIPKVSAGIPAHIQQVSAHDYRSPNSFRPGGVLVVGASATGLQLADEIQASGRPVTLAVGEHVRMPRVYRGRDIQYWMHATGLLDEYYKDFDDLNRVRSLPSPQLIGTADRTTLDLNRLSRNGARLTGRLMGVRDGNLQFSGSLRNVCSLADLKMGRLLDSIDEWIDMNGAAEARFPVERFAPTDTGAAACLGIDLGAGAISTIVWATGFRPDYSWLDVPVLDRKGYIRHDGGVVDAPGMYVLGLPFMRRRKSSFMHGAEDDARDLSEHLAVYLDRHGRRGSLKLAI